MQGDGCDDLSQRLWLWVTPLAYSHLTGSQLMRRITNNERRQATGLLLPQSTTSLLALLSPSPARTPNNQNNQ